MTSLLLPLFTDLAISTDLRTISFIFLKVYVNILKRSDFFPTFSDRQTLYHAVECLIKQYLYSLLSGDVSEAIYVAFLRNEHTAYTQALLAISTELLSC
jgi:hypothetical protein